MFDTFVLMLSIGCTPVLPVPGGLVYACDSESFHTEQMEFQEARIDGQPREPTPRPAGPFQRPLADVGALVLSMGCNVAWGDIGGLPRVVFVCPMGYIKEHLDVQNYIPHQPRVPRKGQNV